MTISARDLANLAELGKNGILVERDPEDIETVYVVHDEANVTNYVSSVNGYNVYYIDADDSRIINKKISETMPNDDVMSVEKRAIPNLRDPSVCSAEKVTTHMQYQIAQHGTWWANWEQLSASRSCALSTNTQDFSIQKR